MSTNAALAPKPARIAPHPHNEHTHGLHARTDQTTPDIHVIACPGAAQHRSPLHARALPVAQPEWLDQSYRDSWSERLTHLCQSTQGTSFNLSTRECVWAWVFGALFTLTAFATMIYF